MGAAACLLRESGRHVEGADVAFAPPMDAYLRSTGIPLHPLAEVSDNYLKSFDLIVVGNVVARNSPDAQRLERLGVPLISFPAALNKFILQDKRVVGVAGTHGKTTTTFLAVQVFEALGEKPGYFIGGVMEDRGSSHIGERELFFIESDEYDCAWFEKIAKFRLYNISDLILTSLEYDHADIYGSLEDIVDQFPPGFVIPSRKPHLLLRLSRLPFPAKGISLAQMCGVWTRHGFRPQHSRNLPRRHRFSSVGGNF